MNNNDRRRAARHTRTAGHLARIASSLREEAGTDDRVGELLLRAAALAEIASLRMADAAREIEEGG